MSWAQEARELALKNLGCALPAGDVSLPVLGRQLWKHVLFSEFALDLPGGLPLFLQDVPRAPSDCAATVRGLCRTLRTSNQSQGAYIEHAERVERELGLAEHARDFTDPGSVETFPFENAVTFRKLSDALLQGRMDDAVSIEQSATGSIWRQFSRGHQMAWQIAVLVRGVISETEELLHKEGALAPETTASAVEQYAVRFSEIDHRYLTLHRAWAEVADDQAFGLSLQDLVQAADGSYRRFTEGLQKGFLSAVEKSSWPPAGMLRQMDIFDRHVAPSLAKDDVTALFLVDALRYDLAADVRQVLTAGLTAQVHAACAQLPTKTQVGMAALLPQASGKLELSARDGELAVSIGGADVSTVAKRDEYMRRIQGDRWMITTLEDILDMGPRKRLPDKTKLVVVRDSGIDKAGEADGKRLPGALPGAVARIGKAVHKLRALGVRRVVITADHGFIFSPSTGPGDAVAKPTGDWVIAKDRFLLGKGERTPHTVRFAPHDVSVPFDAESLVFPRSLGAFQAGSVYHHGGLSLQECVIPVILIGTPAVTRKPSTPVLVMTYRGKGTGRITARVFTVELSCPGSRALAQDWAEDDIRLQLAVHAEDGTEVGKVTPGDHVDQSTLHIRLSAGESIKVPIRMTESYRGKITVKALDPVSLTRLAEVNLETDYME